MPADHPDTIEALMRVVTCMNDRGAYAEAEPMAREAIKLTTAKFGNNNHRTGEAIYLLAQSRHRQGHGEEAADLYKQSIACYPDDEVVPVSITDSMVGLGAILVSRGELDDALALFERALALRVEQYGEGDLRSIATLTDKATLLYRAKRYDQAAPISLRSLELRRRLYPTEHPEIIKQERNTVKILLAAGDAEHALPILNHLVIADAKEFGNPSWPAANALISRASCYIKLHEAELAERDLTEAAAIMAKTPDLPPEAGDLLAGRLASLWDLRGDHAKAEEFRAQIKKR
jgi:tetratricopeptide (TPR) repeat protein